MSERDHWDLLREELNAAEARKPGASAGKKDDIEWPGEAPYSRRADDFDSWLAELAAAADEAALFETLGRQGPPTSKLERQQIRGRLVNLLSKKLKALGSGAKPAGVADAWLLDGAEPAGLQGSAFVVEGAEPWETAVSGADVLSEASALYGDYLHAPATVLDTLALWAAYTYVYDVFGVAAILDISSPTKRCGKTSAVVVTRHLCSKPLLSSNLTPASLFRVIDAFAPTLLIDEADTFATFSDELRGILNAGHTRDTAFTLRAEGEANEPRLFSTWAPKLVAAIGRLPDTIEDRSIRLPLARKPTSVTKADAFDPEAVRAACGPVRRKLTRFTLDALDAIASTVVERPDGLHDRAWNNWRPLLQLGAVAGDDWLKRASEAAVQLSKEEDVEEDFRVLALQHVYEIVEPLGRVASVDVLTELVKREDAPWAKWWEAKLAKDETQGPATALARLLKPFGIRSRDVRTPEGTRKGYDLKDFEDTRACAYLETLSRDRRDNPHEHSDSGTSARGDKPPFVAASQMPSNPYEQSDVAAVAAENQGTAARVRVETSETPPEERLEEVVAGIPEDAILEDVLPELVKGGILVPVVEEPDLEPKFNIGTERLDKLLELGPDEIERLEKLSRKAQAEGAE